MTTRAKAYESRMKAAGFTQIKVWVPDYPEPKKQIKRAAEKLREQHKGA